MKVYRGYRQAGHAHVIVEENGEQRPLKHYVRHSPDGFEWGYGGSGPSELARCILIEHAALNEAQVNDRWADHLPVSYQDFKWDTVARWDRDSFEITSAEIDAWVATHARAPH